MKKNNPWIFISIIIGLLCLIMISLYVFMFIYGGTSTASVSGDADTEEAPVADTAKILTTDTAEEAYSYAEFNMDEFSVEYKGKVKTKSDDKDKDDEDDDDDDDDEDKDEDFDDDYILPKSASEKLTEEDLEDLSAKELTYARNEIYARHGRVFKSDELQDYFSSKDWYDKDEDFDDHDLGGVERDNAEFISQYQKDHDLTYKAN